METDSNLLFGVLALQADLITQDQFVQACTLWTTRKNTALADLLMEQGWLTAPDRAAVDRLLECKLKKHNGNAQASLAEVASNQVQRLLAVLNDSDVRRSLDQLSQHEGHILLSTVTSVPETRERYTLTRLHASGGIGRVWLARDSSLGREVALKELQPERIDNPAFWSRFLKEAQITGQLEHPGIVPVYELSRRSENQQPFYTMRFVKGRTLTEAAQAYHHKRKAGQAGPLDLSTLLNAFVGVCQAVAYAHSRGVLHRDLKGHNVVLGDYGEVILLDWGLAKLIDQPADDAASSVVLNLEGQEATMQGQVLGTPAYMAPEQADGRLDKIDRRTDVYGLGSILYEILTGQPPFTGKDTKEVLRKVREEEPLRPRTVCPGVPAPLEAVCLRAIAKEPTARYATAAEVAQEIRCWLAGEPVTAYREPWTVRAARWARRHKPLVTGLGALLLTTMVCLTVAAVLIWREQARTENNFQKAFQAIQTLTEVGNIASQPGLSDAGAELSYRKAVGALEELLLDAPNPADCRQELARSHHNLGLLFERQERLNEAEAEYQQARASLEKLVGEFPGQPRYQQTIADCHESRGNLLATSGRMQEAGTAYRQALDIRTRLAADFPSMPSYQQALVSSYGNLGRWLKDTDQVSEAEKAYREALRLEERLVSEFPDEPEYRAGLARLCNLLGTLLQDSKRLPEGEALFRRAIDQWKQLARDFAAKADYHHELASAYNNLANLLHLADRSQDALEALRQAVVLQERLVTSFPAVVNYRQSLATMLGNLSGKLRALGQLKEAEASLRRALAEQEKLTADHPAVPDFQSGLGMALHNLADWLRSRGEYPEARRLVERAIVHERKALEANPKNRFYRQSLSDHYWVLAAIGVGEGKLSEAAAAAEELPKIFPSRWEEPFYAAELLARCVALAADDKALPAPERQQRARGYGDRAMHWLQDAVAKGPIDAKVLQKAPFTSLGDRDDFQRLLQQLQGQKER